MAVSNERHSRLLNLQKKSKAKSTKKIKKFKNDGHTLPQDAERYSKKDRKTEKIYKKYKKTGLEI